MKCELFLIKSIDKYVPFWFHWRKNIFCPFWQGACHLLPDEISNYKKTSACHTARHLDRGPDNGASLADVLSSLRGASIESRDAVLHGTLAVAIRGARLLLRRQHTLLLPFTAPHHPRLLCDDLAPGLAPKHPDRVQRRSHGTTSSTLKGRLFFRSFDHSLHKRDPPSPSIYWPL